MATVTDAILLFIVTWLGTWAMLMVLYLCTVLTVDYLRGRWQRYHRMGQRGRDAQAQTALIQHQAEDAIMRMSAMYAAAIRQMGTRRGPDDGGAPTPAIRR
jgi:hypothetical protein